MREPTEAIVSSYDGPHGEAEWGCSWNQAEFVQVAWRAMIDAALAPPVTPAPDAAIQGLEDINGRLA